MTQDDLVGKIWGQPFFRPETQWTVLRESATQVIKNSLTLLII